MKTVVLEFPKAFSKSSFSLSYFRQFLGLFSEPSAYGDHLSTAIDPCSPQFSLIVSLGLEYHIRPNFKLTLTYCEFACTLIRQARKIGSVYELCVIKECTGIP